MAINAKGSISKSIVWVILVLLIVGLAGFGATNFGGGATTLGKVGDTEIDANRYARELQQELQAISAQTGQNVTLAQARQFGIDQIVLQRLVSSAALADEVGKIGLSVGDEEVQRQVLTTRGFQGLTGEFDRAVYEDQLRRNGLTPAEFENSIRADAASSMLTAAVSNGFDMPADYTDAVLTYLRERRNFSWIELTEFDLAEPLPEPTEEELRAYYDENQDDFMIPAAKQITYAWLAPETIVDSVQVDETALQQLYEDRADEYNRPERRLVERLVFGSQDQADAAMQAIQSGEKTFEEVVQDRGLDLVDIDLGDVSQDELGDAGAEVFALADPGVVGPFDTNLGPALFRMNGILAAQVTPFEDVRDTLRDELALDAARRSIADQITEFDDLLAGGATIEDLADETDMELGQIDWSAGVTDGIAGYPEFASAAAAVTEDDYPEIAELGDGGVFTLRLNDTVPERPEEFDVAIDQVRTDYQVTVLKQKLTELAETLKSDVDGGQTISSLGYPVTVDTQRTRDAFIENAPQGFLDQVFSTEAGESLIVEGADTIILVYVAEILPPDESDPDTARIADLIADDANQTMGQDALIAFTRAVEAEAGISINQATLNAVHTQFP